MAVAGELQRYYSTPGVMTDPGDRGHLFDGLPADIPALCGIVQGLIIHVHWAERMGVTLSEERRNEANLRAVPRQLARIIELDSSPLTVARPKEKRLVGNCRDYSTFMAAILRRRGAPARARCGFGMYFTPGRGEDHWVFEYWHAGESRWLMADAQLDAFQRDALKIAFDPWDMPAGQFLPAGEAWRRCRQGEADPEAFGIFDCHGLWFIAGNLVRDLLSLNKVELLPWDGWGLMPELEQKDFDVAYLETLDRVAALTIAGDGAFPEIRALLEDEARLRPPEGWRP